MSFTKRVESLFAAGQRAQRAYVRMNLESWEECEIPRCVGTVLAIPTVFLSFNEVLHMKTLQEMFSGVRVEAGDSAAADASFEKRYPLVHMLMTATPGKGAVRRQVATLTLVCEDGMFKAGLRDRQNAVSLWVSAETFQGAFDALEVALGLPAIPWRKTQDWNTRARK